MKDYLEFSEYASKANSISVAIDTIAEVQMKSLCQLNKHVFMNISIDLYDLVILS